MGKNKRRFGKIQWKEGKCNFQKKITSYHITYHVTYVMTSLCDMWCDVISFFDYQMWYVMWCDFFFKNHMWYVMWCVTYHINLCVYVMWFPPLVVIVNVQFCPVLFLLRSVHWLASFWQRESIFCWTGVCTFTNRALWFFCVPQDAD